jgi:alpha-L-fucosidase
MRSGVVASLRMTIMVAGLIPFAAAAQAGASGAGPYQATTESLRSHKAPQWYEDAKFGIFIHWGPYAVPAYHEWYVEMISPKANFGFMFGAPPYTATRGDLPEQMFKEYTTEDAVKYHTANWGADFPYDNFIPMFKAEKFDPAGWAQLFKDAGAQYVVLTAKHGDEFAMWPSKFTHRNAMEMGPHRDLAGDLAKAVRGSGLKMGFYHNTTYTFWDPRYPGRDWVDYMNNSIKELVDLYHPSVLWGDVDNGPIRDVKGRPLPADFWGSKQVLAYYYNHSTDPDGVVANDRWGVDIDGKFLGDFSTPERTRMDTAKKEKWETCDSLDPNSWGYSRNLKESDYMTPNQVVDYLADVVSKNGNLLINIGPRADGTIPEVMQSCLRQVGAWLKVNGEAIYGSRYWEPYKDGDVRFTRKGNTLYAIALEWPEDTLRLTSLAGKGVTKVEMLGLAEPVKWKQDIGALLIEPPAKRPCHFAYTFKITCRNL